MGCIIREVPAASVLPSALVLLPSMGSMRGLVGGTMMALVVLLVEAIPAEGAGGKAKPTDLPMVAW